MANGVDSGRINPSGRPEAFLVGWSVVKNAALSSAHDRAEIVRHRLLSLVVLVLFGLVVRAQHARAEEGDPVTIPASEPARVRLRELFVAGTGEVKVPASPRFVSICEKGRRGSRLLIGWVLPGVGPDERAELVRLAAMLEQNGSGRLPARLATFDPATSAHVTLDAIGPVPMLVVVVDTLRVGANPGIELFVLDAVEELKGDPAAAGLVRRYLAPLARGVVEVHPREGTAAVRVTKPLRHVVERGDTLSEIASTHGLDLDVLVRLNGVDPKEPIHPGEELKLNAGSSPRPKLYVTKQGDTLAKVARHFGVSEKALLDINRIGVERLTPGQKLVLPP